MKVVRRSILSGNENWMDLNVTQEQMRRFEAGEKVQNVFPHLSADHREFILNGITQEEWSMYMGKDDEFEEDRFTDETER